MVQPKGEKKKKLLAEKGIIKSCISKSPRGLAEDRDVRKFISLRVSRLEGPSGVVDTERMLRSVAFRE